jgi:hypothetical protein
LSSAILYLAIVAIWAGVLIPRWLRRDSSAGEDAATAQADHTPDGATSPQRQEDGGGDGTEVRPAVGRPEVGAELWREMPEPRPDAGPDREHQRVLSARRRLLLLLMALAAASVALAYLKMAAWWVVVPPSVMLVCYLTLLRSASKADAERRELDRAATAGATAAGPRAAPRTAAPEAAAPPPARDAEVIDISSSRMGVGQEFYDQYADAKLRAVGD